MIQFTPLTRQLLHDDHSAVVWLITIDATRRYTSWAEDLTIGGDTYAPNKVVRITPPATLDMTGGVQPYSTVELADEERLIYDAPGEEYVTELAFILINGVHISEKIILSRGGLRNKSWQNGVYKFNVLNLIDMSRVNARLLTDSAQKTISVTDGAFEHPGLSTAGWRE